MKGTLFSADFAIDKNGNHRLLELNTDTGFADYVIENNLDLTDFISHLSSSNITEVHLIYKPEIQDNIAEYISASLVTDAPFITSITETKEILDSIYPSSVEDSDSKFILRLAYDERALFDSEYCANTLNVLDLFVKNGDTGSITELYHSSSVYGVIDTLSHNINPDNVADIVVKQVNTPHFNTEFGKLGWYQSGSEFFSGSEYKDEIYNQYISQLDNANYIIQTYHIDDDAIDAGFSYSTRGYFILYGTDLDIITLSIFNQAGLLGLPTVEDLSGDINKENIYSRFSDKHYYEFATNMINDHVFRADGIYETEKLISSSLETIPALTLKPGDIIQSLKLGGNAPDTDNYIELYDWSYPGKELPSGSIRVDSTVVNLDINSVSSNLLNKIEFVNGETLLISLNHPVLTYQSSSDSIRYNSAINVEIGDSLITNEMTLLEVSQSYIAFLENDNGKIISMNTEDSDTFIVSGSNVLIHNNPCFVAGTPIKMKDGEEKNIEDVIVGDIVCTFNHKNSSTQFNKVLEVMVKDDQPTIIYEFSNGTTLEGTPDHPLYVVGKGYSSYDPIYTFEDSELEVQQIAVGDHVQLFGGNTTEITFITESESNKTVYNLKNVDNNHNFFANEVLVHNRFRFKI